MADGHLLDHLYDVRGCFFRDAYSDG